MSPHLPAITGNELARVAVRLGFLFDRQSGSHAVYVRQMDRARVVIPLHHGKILKPKTLLGILQDLGITVEELRKLL